MDLPTLIMMFPLLLPLWEQRPLVLEDLYPGPYPAEVAPELLALQPAGLAAGDRDLRMRTFAVLASCRLPETTALLRERLLSGVETDSRALAALVGELAKVAGPQEVDPAFAAELTRHPSEAVRFCALALYGRLAAMDPAVPAAALEDPAPGVRHAAARIVRERGAEFDPAFLAGLLDSPEPVLAAAAATAMFSRPSADSAPAAFRAAAASRHVPVRLTVARGLAALPPATARALALQLAADSHASVRTAVAETWGRSPEIADRAVLISLMGDSDADVRRGACGSGMQFPHPDTVAALVLALGDSYAQVRRAAEDSLVALHGRVAVVEPAATRMRDPDPKARLHSWRVLGRLGRTEYSETIAGLLEQEDRPDTIEGAVFSLGRLKAAFAAAAIARRAGHPSPSVRCAVAVAVGHIADRSGFSALETLPFDPDETVRQAAILAMGDAGDGEALSATALKVLETVDMAKMSSRNRAAAAWSAARLLPVNPALRDRLVVQGTEAIIPMSGAMVFEESFVLATVAFSVCSLGAREPSCRKAAESVLAVHSRVFRKGDPSPGPQTLVPTDELRESARQARMVLEGRVPDEAPRPLKTPLFPVGIVQRFE